MVVDAVRAFLAAHAIEPCRLVVACSGGVDSTALLLAMDQLRPDGFELVCAHVNHHLRGEESDEDERFIRHLCDQLTIPFVAGDGSLDPELVRRSGIEAAAREVRTRLLARARLESGAAWVATAHQMNDQAETIVMRLMTGSGIAGLRGIHPLRDDRFIRPLLGVLRSEIEAFLRVRGITARIDRMNADPRYLRVRIRESLRAYDDSLLANIAAIADQARDQWSALETLIDAAECSFARVSEDYTRFTGWPDDLWVRRALLHRHIQRLEPTREVSAADLERIDGERDSIRRLTVTGTLEILRENDDLVLRRIATPTADFELTLAAGSSAFIPEIDTTIAIRRIVDVLTFDKADRSLQLIQLPPGSIAEFTVRNRRDGDRFRPLNLGSEKKLKDVLIDRKVPVDRRDRLPLVVWNREIVWIAGVEVSDSFKLTDEAGDIYEISLRQ